MKRTNSSNVQPSLQRPAGLATPFHGQGTRTRRLKVEPSRCSSRIKATSSCSFGSTFTGSDPFFSLWLYQLPSFNPPHPSPSLATFAASDLPLTSSNVVHLLLVRSISPPRSVSIPSRRHSIAISPRTFVRSPR